MRILHFSDIHFWAFGLDGDLTFKRLLGVANLLARRARQFPRAAAKATLDRILHTEADVVCFTGDVSTSSLRSEFRAGQEGIGPIAERWGDRFLDVPGNHDRYTRVATRRRLYEEHFGRDRQREFPYLRTVGDVDFVGIDTARSCFVSSRGSFPPARQQGLRDLLASRPEAARPLVMLGHYPYALVGGKTHRWNHRLKEGKELAALVAEARPALYLHGHVHHRWAHCPVTTPQTICVNAGSAGMRSSQPDRQAGFVVIDLNATTGAVNSAVAHSLHPGSFSQWDETRIWPEKI